MARLWTPERADYRSNLLRWVEARMPGCTFDADKSVATAVVRQNVIAAVVVYHDRRFASIEMSIAADTPRWATKGVVATLLASAFDGLGCRRITCVVRSDNDRSRRLAEGLGFRQEGYQPDAFEDADAVLYGMTRSAWQASRWHCRREQERRAA